MPDNSQQLIEFCVSISSHAGGAAISALHDYFYSKKTAIVSIVGFAMGLGCSVWLSDDIARATGINIGSAGFMVGLLGRFIVTAILSLDIKSVMAAYMDKKLGIDTEKYRDERTSKDDKGKDEKDETNETNEKSTQ